MTPPADVDLGAGLGVPITTVTDADGLYLFEDLPAGEYTVAVDVLTASETALQSTYPELTLDRLAAAFDADGGNDSTSALTLAAGEDNLDQDFGFIFLPKSLPNTGFVPGRVTILPNQPAEKQYSESGGMVLNISSLGIKLDIVGACQR